MPDNIPKGAVQTALEKQFFGRFTSREAVVSIAVTAAVIMNNNPERIGWVLVNTGNIQITIRLDREITAGQGIIAAQQGDTIASTFIEDGQLPTREWSAIASAAGGEIYLLEFIREGVL
jgi:hypothetical protein